MDLEGQHVVIIGGSSGMGLATAAGAAAAGAKVTIASSGQSRLDAALATLPVGCSGVVVDVRIEASVAEALARIGELDHLVYTAGDSVIPQPLAQVPLDEARRLFDVRFWGAVTAVKHVAPRIRAGGSVVLTSGTVAVRPSSGAALVAGGAAAIEGLTRGLALELAPVRVNAVRPGAIRTPMWAGTVLTVDGDAVLL
jgi:NAD(P)-dependent dehydrogenase (short-subunit alcohol dehydrogenase family)